MAQENKNLTTHERMHEFMQLHGGEYILPYLDKLDKARLCQGKISHKMLNIKIHYFIGHKCLTEFLLYSVSQYE